MANPLATSSEIISCQAVERQSRLWYPEILIAHSFIIHSWKVFSGITWAWNRKCICSNWVRYATRLGSWLPRRNTTHRGAKWAKMGCSNWITNANRRLAPTKGEKGGHVPAVWESNIFISHQNTSINRILTNRIRIRIRCLPFHFEPERRTSCII